MLSLLNCDQHWLKVKRVCRESPAGSQLGRSQIPLDPKGSSSEVLYFRQVHTFTYPDIEMLKSLPVLKPLHSHLTNIKY